MTLTEFSQATLEQRCDAVWEWGFFVGKRHYDGSGRVLYSLNGYFAEMSIRSADNKIESVKVYSRIDKNLQTLFKISDDNPFVRSHKLAF